MPSGVVLPLCLMAVGASGCFSGSWDYEALEAVCAGIPWLVLGIVGFARWPRSGASEGPEDTEQDAG